MANRFIEVVINAKDNASKKINGATKNMTGLKKAVVAVGAAAAVGAALFVAGAIKMINATARQVSAAIKLGDQYDKMGKRLDVAVESLSEWVFIVERAGGSAGVFEVGMKGLITQMKAAQDGTKLSIDAFKDLGVEIEDSAGNMREAEDVFEDVVSAISGMKSPTEQAAAAIQIFGKSGLKLLPTIRQTNEEIEKQKELAQDLGLVLSKDFTDGAAALNDSLDLLSQASAGVGRELVAAFGSDTAVLVETLAIELTDLFDVFQTDGLGASDVMLELGKVMDDINGTVRVVGAGFKVAAAAKKLLTEVNTVDKYRDAMDELTSATMEFNQATLEAATERSFEANILAARAARETTKEETENAPPIEVPIKFVTSEVVAPPKITTAAEPGGELANEVMLIEDLIAAEALLNDQQQLRSENEGERLLAEAELLRQNQAEIDIILQKEQDRIDAAEEAAERAMDAAEAVGRIGQATVTAFLQGENTMKAFAKVLKNEVINALAAVIAKLLIIQAFKFFTGGIGGVKDGGEIPRLAQGGALPGYASGGGIGRAIPDGPRGFDSVPFIGEPGENVIDRTLSQQLRSYLASRESSAMADPSTLALGGGSSINVALNIGRPVNHMDNLDLGRSVISVAEQLAEEEL